MSQSSSTGESSIGGDVFNSPLIGRDVNTNYKQHDVVIWTGIGVVVVVFLSLILGRK